MANDHSRSGPIGTLLVAQSYLLSAQELSKLPEQRLGRHAVRPIAFLVSHGWELALKAFLRADGMSERELAAHGFGHQLDKLLSEAEQRGLSQQFQMSDDGRALLEQLSYAGGRHEARYLNLNRPRLTYLNFMPLIEEGLRFCRTFVGEGRRLGRSWYDAEQQSVP